MGERSCRTESSRINPGYGRSHSQPWLHNETLGQKWCLDRMYKSMFICLFKLACFSNSESFQKCFRGYEFCVLSLRLQRSSPSWIRMLSRSTWAFKNVSFIILWTIYQSCLLLCFLKEGKPDFNIPDKLSVPASECQVGSLVLIALSTALEYFIPFMWCCHF